MQRLIKNLNILWSKFKRDKDLFWESLEEQLIMSDVSVNTAAKILEKLRENAYKEKINSIDTVKNMLKEQIINILDSGGNKSLKFSTVLPTVFLVVGVNGVGKTTTIAKMANMFKNEGKKILLSAADTYRSAAVEQIQYYAQKLGLEIVYSKRFSDPGAVVYDSIEKAKARGIYLVIIDTAGRMHTSYNLMEELKKIKKVINKKIGREPDETLIVIDSTTGQNAKLQTEVFNNSLKLTGIILTKTDSTSKGGIVLTIKNDLNIPIKMVGNGEKLGDLYYFDPVKFSEMLLS